MLPGDYMYVHAGGETHTMPTTMKYAGFGGALKLGHLPTRALSDNSEFGAGGDSVFSYQWTISFTPKLWFFVKNESLL